MLRIPVMGIASIVTSCRRWAHDVFKPAQVNLLRTPAMEIMSTVTSCQ